MTQLANLIADWSSYLERWPIVLQIAVVITPLVLMQLLRRRLPAGSPLRRWPLTFSLLLIVIGTGLLGLLGIRNGLAIFLASIVAWWSVLGGLRRLLERRIDSALVHQLDSSLVRPLFVLIVLLMAIEKLANIEELAVVPLGSWFGNTFTLGQLGSSLLGIYLLIVGSGPLAQLLSWLISRLINLSPGSSRATTLLVRYSIVVTGLIWALDHAGFDRTAILTIAGGLSLGLGFGVKEVVSNFISGLWLLIEGSVRPGEVLFIDGNACEVRSLGLRAAMLWRDLDNTELLIPNQTFFSTTTITFTGSDGMRRCQVLLSAAYRHRPRDVIALMVKTTREVPGILSQRPVVALVLNYGESGVEYGVRFWIANPMAGSSLMSAVREALWDAFAAHGIEIPYPQRVLHQAPSLSCEVPAALPELDVVQAQPDPAPGPSGPSRGPTGPPDGPAAPSAPR
ncbi:MAG: mechanosensitive ion channel domain-containing protein [Synechococcaceae cyanobacterium]|nr:mechanosensitive ion channel domain-containing protein [Synechococcaceae cyanobacterium]